MIFFMNHSAIVVHVLAVDVYVLNFVFFHNDVNGDAVTSHIQLSLVSIVAGFGAFPVTIHTSFFDSCFNCSQRRFMDGQ